MVPHSLEVSSKRNLSLNRICFLWLAFCISKSWQALPPSAASQISIQNDLSHNNLPQVHNLFQRRLPWSKKQRRSNQSSIRCKGRKGSCGTRLSLRRPTPESVAQWFAALGREFNHDSVGMTNPCLHISLSSFDDKDESANTVNDRLISNAVSSQSYIPTEAEETRVTSSSSPLSAEGGDNVENAWWPKTCQQMQQAAGWRLIRYRRRIGRGQECYERVRNFALDWEFAFGQPQQHQENPQQPEQQQVSTEQEMGILAIHSQAKRHSHAHETTSWISPASRRDLTSSYGNHDHPAASDGDLFAPLTRDTARHVLQLWAGPGGRRLVTYTGTSGYMFRVRCLPRLYAVNPVMVVYDLVDQRGPGTTYTSTAYATLKGHWISGEERVTVALRDGVQGDVDVEILSYSRPAPTLVGKLIWPFIGRRQRDFFERQLEALEQVPRRSSATAIERPFDSHREPLFPQGLDVVHR